MAVPTPPHPALAPPLPPLKALPVARHPKDFTSLVTFIDDSSQPSNFHPDMPKTWFIPVLSNLPSHFLPKGKVMPEDDSAEVTSAKDLELKLLVDPVWTNENIQNKGLAVLFLMCRRYTLDVNPTNMPLELIDTARSLVHSISRDHLRLVPDKVLEFAHGTLRLCTTANRGIEATKILGDLVSRYAPLGSLTKLHAIFLEACLREREYSLALQLLAHPIENVTERALKYVDVLSYHYLGGLIYLAVHKWEDARDFFEIVVTAPGNAASSIQIAAHKKLVLVNLMITGKCLKYPKYLSSAVKAAIKSHAAIYTELGTVFEGLEEGKLQEIWAKGRDIFLQDGNATLVNYVWDTISERKLLALKKTFSRLGLDEVAKRIALQGSMLDVDTTINIVTKMIREGRLQAEIEASNIPGQPPILTFHTEVPPAATTASREDLSRLTEHAQNLSKLLAEHDMALGLKDKWLKHAGKFGTDESVANVDMSTNFGNSNAIRGVGGNWQDDGY